MILPFEVFFENKFWSLGHQDVVAKRRVGRKVPSTLRSSDVRDCKVTMPRYAFAVGLSAMPYLLRLPKAPPLGLVRVQASMIIFFLVSVLFSDVNLLERPR